MVIKEELRFRQQKDLYEAIINAQREMICRFLPDTTLTFVNHAYCKYMGLPEEKLIGTRWLRFLPEEMHQPIKDHLEKVGRTGKIITLQHEVIMPDGKLAWQQWTDIPIYDNHGEIQEMNLRNCS